MNMKATEADIRHAYRLLLGREPDPSGLACYTRLLVEQRVSALDIAAIIESSDEYKARRTAEPALIEIDFHGLRLFPWRGDSLIGDHVRASGEYEPHVLPAFVERIPSGGTVLDVGANIGTFTLSAARKVGPLGSVHAIEPIARNVQSLCAGVWHNGFRNVSVLPVAASSTVGVVPMLRNANSSNGIVDVHVVAAMADAFVPCQPLHVLLRHLERLDVIKIDIEGHEPVAWPSLSELVRKHRPAIFTEFNPVAIRNHSRVEPEIYLSALFDVTRQIETIEFDGVRQHCSSVAEVMNRWTACNARAGTDGTCHLDLYCETGPT
ncbi:MAG: FkbM family methyltransferase [Dokdonella sp.]|nr:MAG: FkbM family methyltransferase [Dokdonella sp.]MCZ2078166.1 FkbM family methyltransferase [Bryobacterales bacterium]